MLTDVIICQLLLFITLFFFCSVINIFSLWYLGGLYLLLLGGLMLLDDGDIFIGFL
jgi:hypothetical protein